MATIVLRSGKGSPLTNTEVDANFSNLNTGKLELGGTYSSGTANGVTYLNGSKVLTSGSALTFDGTNLGVGGASTGAKVSIKKGEAGAILRLTDGSQQSMDISSNAGAGGAGVITTDTVNSGAQAWAISNAEQMRLTSTGLGIGTSSPAYKLEVQTGAFGAALWAQTGGTTSSYTIADFRTGTNLSALQLFGDGTSVWRGGAMRLDSSGNLLLGTTSTLGAKFALYGTQGGTNSNIQITNPGYGTGCMGVNGTSSNFKIYNCYSNGTIGTGVGIDIDTSGNVGIGTSSPTYKVDATAPNLGNTSGNEAYLYRGTTYTGNTDAFEALYQRTSSVSGWPNADLILRRNVDSSVGQSQIRFNGNNSTSFWTNSAERMRITIAGNVGIGTTSPTGKLDVVGGRSFFAANNENYAVGVRYHSSGGSMYFGATSASSTPDGGIFNSGGSQIISFNNNLNVGIGTSSPAKKLDIRGASDGLAILVPSDDLNATNDIFQITNAAVSNVFFIRKNGNAVNTNNSYTGISDLKLKENVVDVSPKLADLLDVRVVSYNLKPSLGYAGDKHIGVVAQELEKIFPGLIEESTDYEQQGDERVDLGTVTKSVKYSIFVPMLIKAIQEQQALIASLTARLDAANL